MNITRLVIVAPFHQIGFFQWHDALLKNQEKLSISVHPIIITNAHLKKPITDPYWNQLREADAVLIYVTRVDPSEDWWALPKFVKQFLKPEAKMLVQTDDEFQWLWDDGYTFWGKRSPNPKFSSPEQFFRDTGILEVPDVHLTVTENPLFKSYTTKPVIQLLLPQLIRYQPEQYTFIDNRPNIAIMRHYAVGSSFMKTVDNIIKPNNFPITIFNWYGDKNGVEYCKALNLPVGSRSYSKLPFLTYEDILWKSCAIGIDDPEGYIGWSRFVMECAMAYIPCIGSTDAVKMLFPELLTLPQDFVRQTELLLKLKNDKEFYKQIAEAGRKRCMEELSTENLCRKFVDLLNKINTPKSWTFEGLLLDFLYLNSGKTIPPRPNTTTAKVSDAISKRLINQEQWDMTYGKWRFILEDRKLLDEFRKKAMDRNA
jgi:glycosyltransferase involved in cell wall biosynthesis